MHHLNLLKRDSIDLMSPHSNRTLTKKEPKAQKTSSDYDKMNQLHGFKELPHCHKFLSCNFQGSQSYSQLFSKKPTSFIILFNCVLYLQSESLIAGLIQIFHYFMVFLLRTQINLYYLFKFLKMICKLLQLYFNICHL